MAETMMKISDIARRFDVSRVSVYRWHQQGLMPRSVQKMTGKLNAVAATAVKNTAVEANSSRRTSAATTKTFAKRSRAPLAITAREIFDSAKGKRCNTAIHSVHRKFV